ncbi:MAG: pyridoxal phosphate-dependent aminotransferase [Sporichthyaceae bacterium]
MEITQSSKLANVAYDVRGPVLEEANRLEQTGHRILKLNIGNPAPFGFDAPDEVVAAIVRNLPNASGYSDSKGLFSARTAVAQYYTAQGVDDVDVDQIYLGNGVSELIAMALQALLNTGDEILIPAPDYPLWTAVSSLAGGRPVHYMCDEEAGWMPDLADIESKISDRTRAIVVINPNNPTGAVYSRDVLEGLAAIARRHGLVLFADEIYDRILFDDAVHTPMSLIAPDVLTITFNGLSKCYLAAGFRSGWAVVTGPRQHARSYLEGMQILANMRLCANVPSQWAIQTALSSPHGIQSMVLPGGRLLEQRDVAYEMLNQIPGVSCVKPKGALYCFPKLDPKVHPIVDDERLCLDLLRSERILLVQGRGFNWPRPDHLRIVTLPHADDLREAITRIARFLSTYRQ